MAVYHTTLFDTWQPAAVAGAEAILFQTPRGGDAAHNDRFTNARGAGQLPADESFECRRVGVMYDEELLQVDADTNVFGALLELRLKDKVVLSAPVRRCVTHSAWGGHFTQAAAATINEAGQIGEGFALDIPVVIPGGARFDVRLVQGAAFAAAQDFKLILEGYLTVPD